MGGRAGIMGRLLPCRGITIGVWLLCHTPHGGDIVQENVTENQSRFVLGVGSAGGVSTAERFSSRDLMRWIGYSRRKETMPDTVPNSAASDPRTSL